MSQLPKTLRIPDVEYIRNFEDVKDFLRDLTAELQKQHQAIYNDIRIKEAVYLKVGTVNYRLIPVGNNLEVQMKVAGVWTKKSATTG